MAKITIGIDLGTTNTCAAIVKDGIAKFLELEPNSLTMPSAVRFVDGKTDNVVIGRLAKRFAIVKPKEVFVSFKTLMQNEEWLNDPKIVESYKIDGKQFTPTDMAAKLLAHIYEVAQSSEFATDGTINNVKICVPAASTPYYKKEVINAAIQAGFGEKDENGDVIYIEEEIDGNKVKIPQGITTIEEPFAAAYSYGHKNGFFDQDKTKDQNIMVYDFGGGTFDVSIINVSTEKGKKPIFKLLGTYGVTHLGGDDMDMAIMKIAAKQFYKEHKIDLINADKDNKGLKKRDVLTAQSTLKELSERAKIEDFAQGATEAHIAVKGLAAKSIIDIMPVVTNISLVDKHNKEFVAIGYECMGEFGIEGRRYFRKGGDNRTHQIHIFEQSNHKDINRHIAVRDFLRTHPDIALEYGELKMELAYRFSEDIEGYCTGKDAFVKQLEKDALLWYQNNESYKTR